MKDDFTGETRNVAYLCNLKAAPETWLKGRKPSDKPAREPKPRRRSPVAAALANFQAAEGQVFEASGSLGPSDELPEIPLTITDNETASAEITTSEDGTESMVID
jgi:hypothetical protein